MTEYHVVDGDIIHFPDGSKMAVRSQSQLIRIPKYLPDPDETGPKYGEPRWRIKLPWRDAS